MWTHFEGTMVRKFAKFSRILVTNLATNDFDVNFSRSLVLPTHLFFFTAEGITFLM